MAPKIKIVDVGDKDVKNDDEYAVTVDAVKESDLPTENTTSETAEETTTIIQEKDENEGEEVSKDTATAESTIAEPTKKIREQQLVKCEKCGKFVTPKTLKYTHSLKCCIPKYQPGRRKKSKIKVSEDTQEVPPPPPPASAQKTEAVSKPPVLRTQPPKTVVKEVVKSFEEMRKERLKERMKQCEERNANLFKQVL